MSFLVLYLAGVLIGLAVMRDRWGTRLVTALVWPLGPMAFVAVLAVVLLGALVLWPGPILAGAAIVGAIAWLLT